MACNAGIHAGHNFIVRQARPGVVDSLLNFSGQPLVIGCGFVRFAHGPCPASVAGVGFPVGRVVLARVELAYGDA
ncbi:MAG: hypothetical protein KBF29_12710, partial [Sterolibacterium sp.]|nr:hypothetical protein [Sterolibacterium sp.]